jgi:signal peptide peptidase SppA
MPEVLSSVTSSLAKGGVAPVFGAASRERARSSANSTTRTIAVIPVIGPIVQRPSWLMAWLGGTSTQQVRQALAEAMADDAVVQVLLIFDCPGGSVYGLAELADEINQAKKAKPITGYADSLSASGGYWLMSQCTECWVTPGGEVGSIGVWMAHEDCSKAFEELGIKTTLISAGKNKVEGNPYEPLDPDAQGFMQSRVDDYYGMFTRHVARGRNVGVDSVRRGMGEGRVLGASQALAEKMVDGIAALPEVLKRMTARAPAARQNAASGRTPHRADNPRLLGLERDLRLLELGAAAPPDEVVAARGRRERELMRLDIEEAAADRLLSPARAELERIARS